MEERAEQVDAIHADACPPAEPRPEPDAPNPRNESLRNEQVEPDQTGHFDELAPLAAEAGDPSLLLPEPRPHADPVREAAAEPDMEAASIAEMRAEPEPIQAPPSEAAVEAEPLVPEAAPLAELPEPEPAPLPEEFASGGYGFEHPAFPEGPPLERPLHERIPAVLPSVELQPVSPAVSVPVFEPHPRVREAPWPADDGVWTEAETVPATPVAAAAMAIPQAAVDAAPSRPVVLAPSRTLAQTLAPALRRAVRLVAVAAVAYICLVLALIVLYRWVNPPASTLMLGQWLAGTEITKRWMPIDRISPNLHRAVITAEDARFCQHRGVDWEEIEVAIERAREGIPRGGSTISMQVVKNLFLWPSKSYVRKAIEIPLTYAIELAWSKRRILEIYLNIVEWGPGVFGAEAAARYHFSRPAALLTPSQAALLAVSLPNPLQRKAGAPGSGTLRLAAGLHGRMQAGAANAACIRPQ